MQLDQLPQVQEEVQVRDCVPQFPQAWFCSVPGVQTPAPQSAGHDAQVSLPSHTPLPQEAEQSLSLDVLQPEGQHPSLLVQEVIDVKVHSASQFAALPLSVSVVQLSLSLQLVGQVEGGSHVSPGSMTLLPQDGGAIGSHVLLELPLSQV